MFEFNNPSVDLDYPLLFSPKPFTAIIERLLPIREETMGREKKGLVFSKRELEVWMLWRGN